MLLLFYKKLIIIMHKLKIIVNSKQELNVARTFIKTSINFSLFYTMIFVKRIFPSSLLFKFSVYFSEIIFSRIKILMIARNAINYDSKILSRCIFFLKKTSLLFFPLLYHFLQLYVTICDYSSDIRHGIQQCAHSTNHH